MNICVQNQTTPNSNRIQYVETKESRALNISVITTRENRRNRRIHIDWL